MTTSGENRFVVPYHKIGAQAVQSAREKVLEAFEQVGITARLIGEKTLELMNASKVKLHFDSEMGCFIESKPHPDNTTRLGALKFATEVFDAMPSKQIDIHDKRQTREIVSNLFLALENARQVGMDDKGTPQLCSVEEELMADMIEVKAKGRGISLLPVGGDE